MLAAEENSRRFPSRWGGPECIKVLPGEWHVTGSDEELVTVLGSCIAVCVRDPELGIGGMNHFLLPGPGPTGQSSARYGHHAMIELLDALEDLGADRRRLEFKITGGSNVGFEGCGVANQNIEFADRFLRLQGIQPKSRDVGSIYPRKVRYHPRSGRLLVCKLPAVGSNPLERREVSSETD